MNHEDVARILAAAQARDQRTVGAADVLAWHEDIGDLDYEDARRAVSLHYRESTRRLMPADVRLIVYEIEEERKERRQAEESEREIEAARNAPPPKERSLSAEELLAELRRRLPKGDPSKLRGPHWLSRNPEVSRRGRWR